MREFKFSNVSVLFNQKDLGPSKRKILKMILTSLGFFILYGVSMALIAKVHFLFIFLLLVLTQTHVFVISFIKNSYEEISKYSKFLYNLSKTEDLKAVNNNGKAELYIKRNGQYKPISLKELSNNMQNVSITKHFPVSKKIYVVFNCLEENMNVEIQSVWNDVDN